jgi:hypothetical protein
MLNSLCCLVENLRICNLRTGSPIKFADLQFADQSKEICGLTYLKNLRICDCGLSPRICGFLKKSCLATFANLLRGWGKLIHEKNLKSKILCHCPFKLSFACTKLYKVETADTRCHSLPTGNYIPLLNLLKGPPPPHTHTRDVSII